MTLSGKEYISDLIPNSGTIQAINDDFRHIVQTLHLWSFYESVKTNLGMSQALIVEKDSAILGTGRSHISNRSRLTLCVLEDDMRLTF